MTSGCISRELPLESKSRFDIKWHKDSYRLGVYIVKVGIGPGRFMCSLAIKVVEKTLAFDAGLSQTCSERLCKEA
jgi:hypothetical protein